MSAPNVWKDRWREGWWQDGDEGMRRVGVGSFTTIHAMTQGARNFVRLDYGIRPSNNFSSDAEAIAFVTARAAEGSQFHIDALKAHMAASLGTTLES